ncbi:hypothetical protein CTAYLR_010372 [Chrysophaeum taylorii]|uniref:Uncharacterized protein n=1 Tax=Chrysophaeum taylorii TaxID=2483200 RepID=A0AAD7UHK2_9STRA|nr:hypothetical protein CTAYLR_010372 [Chrysophaeum taylorii]
MWYVVVQGAQRGPLGVEEVRTLYKAGTVTFSTLAWTKGREGWSEISDIPALKMRLEPIRSRSSNLVAPPPGAAAESSAAASTGRKKTKKKSSGAEDAPPKRKSSFSRKQQQQQQQQQQRRREEPEEKKKMMINGRPVAGGWVEKKTVDGVKYYHNPSLERVQYDKPDALKDENEKDAGEWVWVEDAKEAWVPGRVLKREANGVVVVMVGNEQKKLEEPLWRVSPSALTRLEEDLVLLEDLNEGMMVHVIKERYKKDEIYTWVGASHTVLVSINPFQRLPIYGVKLMNEFARPAPNRLLPPHPFAIANGAYLRLRVDATDQAMLISGESGAGKTECTKQVLSFLAEVAGSATNVEQRILSANPVLEAFGNAKTVRNNNSSRFGRWMEVHFDERGAIASARIENYLLEKSRVVSQARSERSYHVFYQLGNPSRHVYLAGSCFKVQGIDDKADYAAVRRALDQLGFDKKTELDAAFELTAGVLRLGDVEFSARGDGSKVHNQDACVEAAKLVGSTPDALAAALTHTAIEVRGKKTLSPCTPEMATLGAAALAKAIFGRLFDWLVRRINVAVALDESDETHHHHHRGTQFNNNNLIKPHFIGVLDIFGFEIFEKNSFEQLCINYCNEKLQQHFNKHTFKDEDELYKSEGIEFQSVPFIDNQPVLDLIEKKPDGILLALDDEVTAPKGSDAKWLSRCETAHASKKEWKSVAEKATQHVAHSNFFTVCHYAGDVTYISTDFCLKNKDPLGRNLYDLMALEAGSLAREIFPALGCNPRRQPTIAGQFRKQLSSLLKIIDAADPCYIRCVKPNELKKPRTFDAKACVEQLTFAGVFEAVQIRKSGYPFRLAHRRFAARYRPLLAGTTANAASRAAAAATDEARCELILGSVNQDFAGVKLGTSMVLYRAAEHRVLELLRNLALEKIVPVAQRGARRGMGRVYRRLVRRVRDELRATLSTPRLADDAAALDAAIERALAAVGPHQTVFPFLPPELERAKERRHYLQERLDLDVVMRDLLDDKNDEPTYDVLAACVRRADAISAVPGTEDQMALEQRVRDKLAAVAATKIDPLAAAAVDVLDKPLMETVLEEARRARYASPDVQKIEDLLALSDDALTKLQLKRANELNDPDRVVNREIKLKQLALDTYGALFSLDKFQGLRDAREWASRKSRFSTSAKRRALADNMLRHQATAIHCALTLPPPGSNLAGKPYDKKATQMFKCVLGFCGDANHPYPEQLGSEALAAPLAEPGLRIECYAQIIKQLTNNPNAHSLDKAWQLCAVAFASFPPPPAFENTVALFVRSADPAKKDALTAALYAAVYGGPRKHAVKPEELYGLAAQTLNNSDIAARFRDEDTINAAATGTVPPSILSPGVPPPLPH